MNMYECIYKSHTLTYCGHQLYYPIAVNWRSSRNLIFFLDQSVLPLTGPLTSPFGIEGNAWSLSPEGDPHWPDLQYLFLSGTPAMDNGLALWDLVGYRRKVQI